MAKEIKTHAMKVPKEIIAWFFTEVEKHLLEVEMVEVTTDGRLLVDVIYQPKQRLEMMLLIERLNDYYNEQEQMKIDKGENHS